MAVHDLISDVEVQTPQDSLMYAAGHNTLFFHAFGALRLRAGPLACKESVHVGEVLAFSHATSIQWNFSFSALIL